MPWPEVIGKDLKFGLKNLSLWFKNGGKLPTLVCYPDFPSKRTTLYKIASRNKLRLTNKQVEEPTCILFFEDSTAKASKASDYFQLHPNAINLKCDDISKIKVDAMHLEAFGYNTFIDPFTFEGIAVEKSDENAQHDGQKIQCPITEVNSGKIYQILIDNQVNDTHVVDIRVPVMRGEIPLAYLKYKTLGQRFTNDVDYAELTETRQVLSAEEQESIQQFCTLMEVEFAELDVLRHNPTGKIYVIDVNTTPYGPPSGLPAGDHHKAVAILSDTFQREFLS